MEQFRRIGEVVGSLKALMVLREEIQINQRQCCLILDIFSLAFETIGDEIRQNLVLEERNTKWKPLEHPLREVCRVFKEAELYIRQCLDSVSKDWWGQAISLCHSTHCVEFHIHNLLSYFPAVIEAIENAGEMQKKKVMLARKYDKEWNDPELFQWRFGKQYLVPREISKQLEDASREDTWRLIESLKNKSKAGFTKKNDQRLADMIIQILLNGSESEPNTLTNQMLFPSSILMGTRDYQVRRRLGSGSRLKEIQWLGQAFALTHVHAETETSEAEICTLLSLSHPNILQYLCGFYDEDKKDLFLVMELMNKDLGSYMKDNYGPRRQVLLSIPVVVDLMLQIARGMEYLHSKNMYHGDLNPANILLKPRNPQEGGYFLAKVAGFGLSAAKSSDQALLLQEESNPSVWLAPEVVTELERKRYVLSKCSTRRSEKADVYSFGMICFELLTGKVPFEDVHRQADRLHRNIQAGERPLFPHPSPKYLVSLIKKCWQTEPTIRPTFSSICRILRYIKKFLAMNTEFLVVNPELKQLELTCPPVDYCDIEALFLNNFQIHMNKASRLPSVSQIPYEMFAYKIAEKEKICLSLTNAKAKIYDSAGDKSPKNEPTTSASVCGEDNDIDELKKFNGDHTDTKSTSDDFNFSVSSSQASAKKSVRILLQTEEETKNDQGILRLRSLKLSSTSPTVRGPRTNKGNQLSSASITGRRRPSQVLDSKKNRGNQSPMVSSASSSVRRKRNAHASELRSILKTKTVNESPLTIYEHVSDSKSSVRTKRYMSPLKRQGYVSDSQNSKKMTKGNETLRRLRIGGTIKRSNTETNLKIKSGTLSLYAMTPMSPFSSACTRGCGHVSDNEGAYKIGRGRVSPQTWSPSSPYAGAYVSNSHSSSKMNKRASLSPFTLSPLSSYGRTTNGHVSD